MEEGGGEGRIERPLSLVGGGGRGGENREAIGEEEERVYSRTSHNGPSEKRTTSLQRTNAVFRIEITIVLVHK